MTQVSFPTRLGGNGQTISDDADPNTGLLNGGHRTRFVPALQGTVQMADYVFQYADKIDNAASDANRAESARGYVEAVAEDYKHSIINTYQKKATLNINYRDSLYEREGESRTSQNDVSGFLSVGRSSPKWVVGPNGRLREVPVDTLARQWRNGKCIGASFEPTSTNIIEQSEDFSNSYWLKGSRTIESNAIHSPLDGVMADKIVESSTDTGQVVDNRNSLGEVAPDNYTFSCFVKAAERKFAILRVFHAQHYINLNNGNIEIYGSDPSGVERVSFGSEKLANGWWRAWATVKVTENITRGVQVGCATESRFDGYIYQGDGESGIYAWGAQLENTAITSYIPTSGSSSTRSGDGAISLNENNISDIISSGSFTAVILQENVPDVRTNSNREAVLRVGNNSGSTERSIRLRYIGASTATLDYYDVIVRGDEFTIYDGKNIRRKNAAFSWDNVNKRLITSMGGSLVEDVVMGDSPFIDGDDVYLSMTTSSITSHVMLFPYAMTAEELNLITEAQ